MKLHKSALAVLLALSCTACGIFGSDPFETGRDAYAQRDYHTARVALATAMNAENADPEAAELYARTLLALGDGESAERILDTLRSRTSPPADLASLSAQAALLRGDFELALERAGAAHGQPLGEWVAIRALGELDRGEEAMIRSNAAIEAYPDHAPLLAMRGAMAVAMRQVSEAKEYSARALAADADDLDALMLAGQLRVMRADYAAAHEFYTKAHGEHPADLGALFALAAVEADMGEYEQAETHLASLLSAAPGHPMGLLLSARLAFVEGDLDEAHTIVQQSESNIGRIPQGRLLMGEIAYLRGFPAQAIVHLEAFLAVLPGHAHGSTVLARAYSEQGEEQRAWDLIAPLADSAVATPQMLALASDLAGRVGEPDRFAARLAAILPDGFAEEYRAAQNALDRGDGAEAERRFAALIAEGGDRDAVILNNGAHAALAAGNPQEALRRARAAHELAPRDPRVRDTLGWVLLENGEAGPALNHLTAAVEGQPGNLQIRWHYANALIANGRSADARRIIGELRQFAGTEQRAAMDRLLARI
ncbi:tetratricopeptide repeat protein [Aurantiacibacter marinus]|uniref:Tetratricopeptide repeat-like domain-containing protein n=1 Tax=Aurantiacibacter marinus TaxID=874156 RepID=A0A0H0XPM3_9SPHN|nr:tetratricopeptide repeat protein [Aurantiacibacter marinus]KLI64563.1 hypothetical protein AAV99_03050 [Aurantiacibacter marinus]